MMLTIGFNSLIHAINLNDHSWISEQNAALILDKKLARDQCDNFFRLNGANINEP